MRDIFKVFKTWAGDFTALNGVDVCLYYGDFVSVVGKSGSGTSTLVNMLTGIDHPTSGSVRVGDTYIHQHSEGQMSIWRGANLGIIFQFFQLLPMLSILENIMLPMDFAKIFPLPTIHRSSSLTSQPATSTPVRQIKSSRYSPN
jgi:putative ABC transport system ATP-binding protein